MHIKYYSNAQGTQQRIDWELKSVVTYIIEMTIKYQDSNGNLFEERRIDVPIGLLENLDNGYVHMTKRSYIYFLLFHYVY